MKTSSAVRLEARRKKLAKIAGSENLESLAQGGGSGEELESYGGEGHGVDALRHAEEEALRKLKNGDFEDLTEQEERYVEAVVERTGRQVAFIKDGKFEDLPDPWTHFNDGLFRTNIELAIPSVGRVERYSASGRTTKHVGTGFIVGDGLMMTNRHVAEVFVKGVGSGERLSFVPGLPGALDLGREVDFDPTDLRGTMRITGMRMIHPFWDMALLEIASLPDGVKPLRLSIEAPEELVEREIAVIGYPGRGNDRSQEALDLEEQYFGNIFGVKRIAPGEIDGRLATGSYKRLVPSMIHDSTTLAGCSGSLLWDPAKAVVHGLHFKGVTLKANYSVPMYELARDRRVVDMGVNFTGAVDSTLEWDRYWNEPVVEESVLVKPRTPGKRTPAAEVRSSRGQAPVPSPVSGEVATFTIPLHISVSLGPVAGAPHAVVESAGAAEQVRVLESFQMPVMYDGLEDRAGYQPAFLGLPDGEEVPLPHLTEKGKKVVARTEDGEPELKYHHFSVIMHKKRRLALLTAANLDWRKERHETGGRKPSRKELTGIPDGVLELWATDDRIAEEFQLPDIFFTRDNQAFDKGHLVRRDDVAWGDSFDDMQMANGDTYHTTNCSPQVKGFNQAPHGKFNWGDLENMIQSATKAEKAIVLAGPVLAKDDRYFLGVTENGPLKVQVPRKFWKIIVAMTPDGVKAFGFLPEQDLSAVPTTEEFVLPDDWEDKLVSIAEIESKLGGLLSLEWCRVHDAFKP